MWKRILKPFAYTIEADGLLTFVCPKGHELTENKNYFKFDSQSVK